MAIAVSALFHLAVGIAESNIESVTRNISFSTVEYVPGSGNDASLSAKSTYKAIRTRYVREFNIDNSTIRSAYKYIYEGPPPYTTDKLTDGTERRTIISITRDPTNSLVTVVTTE